MADATHIEWTDATWNPVTGCSVVSPGCTNCYAMKLAGTRLRHHPSRAGLTIDTKAGPVWNGQVRFNAEWLDQPLRWARPRRIFVCAHGDLFHEDVPVDWIDQVFAVMALSPQHTFQVLTKRAARMRAYLTAGDGWDALNRIIFYMMQLCEMGWPTIKDQCERHGLPWTKPTSAHDWWPLPNGWLGVSAEDQDRWNARVAELIWTPAARRFVSLEPMLGPVNPQVIEVLGGDAEIYPLMGTVDCEDADGEPIPDLPGLDWVILGGESGPGARPMHPDWARQVRDACAEAGVAFFFKQWGAWEPVDQWSPRLRVVQRAIQIDGDEVPDDVAPQDVGGQRFTLTTKKAAGRRLDGVEHNAMPEPRR